MKARRIRNILMMTLCIVMIAVSTAFAVTESEPNDYSYKANPVTVGTTIYGQLGVNSGKNDTRDIYVFKAPMSGKIKVIATIYECENGFISGPDFQVMNSQKDCLEFFSIGGYEIPLKESRTVNVTCGKKYYISASEIIYDNFKYKIYTKYVIDTTKISSLTSKSNGFNVKWNKKANASFYQIRYTPKTTYSNYSWNKAKKVEVSSKCTSKTIKNLKKNKNYYVSVRVGRKIDGKTYYSNWSTKKLVKTH